MEASNFYSSGPLAAVLGMTGRTCENERGNGEPAGSDASKSCRLTFDLSFDGIRDQRCFLKLL